MLMDVYIIYFYQIIKFFDEHSTSVLAFSTIALAVITAYYAVQTRFLTKNQLRPAFALSLTGFSQRRICSWITIFRNTETIKFIITNTKVRVFDNIAVVVCLENIETLLDGEIVRLGVIATNIFEQMENQWLLIHHHGSSVSNYIPANISS